MNFSRRVVERRLKAVSEEGDGKSEVIGCITLKNFLQLFCSEQIVEYKGKWTDH